MEERKVTFEIVERLGVLTENKSGWTKEINLVSWNGQEPKYDIRDWDPMHERSGKGITLTHDELSRLVSAVSADMAFPV